MAYFYPQYLEEIERVRKGATTKALTGRDVDPFAQALEAYGTTAARLSDERARAVQIKKDYLQSKGQRIVEQQQKQQTASQAVSGVGSLALTGYQAGKSLGLWGVEKGVTSLTNVAGNAPSSVAETGLTLAGDTMPEAIAGGGSTLIESGTALAPEVAGLADVGLAGVEATAAIGAETLAPALITETTAAVVPEIAAGTAAAAEGAVDIWATLTPLLAILATVICTELHRQGILDDETYNADSYYGSLLPDEVLIGYNIWAIPLTRKMRDSKKLTKIVSIFAIPWAFEMAHRVGVRERGTILGKVLMFVGIPLCRLIGRIVIGLKEVRVYG